MMLEFKPIIPNDTDELKKYLCSSPAHFCDRTPGVAVMWRKIYSNCFCIFDGTLIIRSMLGGKAEYLCPVGRNFDGAVEAVIAHCAELGEPAVFYGLTDCEADLLAAKHRVIDRHADRDWFDYVYDKSALLNLTGKKYAAQRNHIHKFTSLYPGYTFEPISGGNIPELIAFTEKFHFHSLKEGGDAAAEVGMCLDALREFPLLGMVGGALKAGGEVIGYTIGEAVGDTFFVHIEKADTDCPGSYQVLSNSFLRAEAANDDIKFVNREEDCGDEGLRRSKLSYHPIDLPPKNTLTVVK